jgi:hypothetical protein
MEGSGSTQINYGSVSATLLPSFVKNVLAYNVKATTKNNNILKD